MAKYDIAKDLDDTMKNTKVVFDMLHAKLDEWNVPMLLQIPIMAAPLGIMLVGGALMVFLVRAVFTAGAALADIILQIINTARVENAPALNDVMASTLSEVLGLNISADELSTNKGPDGNLQRAEVMGKKLYDVLESEFADAGAISPEQGEKAAHRFTGFTMNFSIANAFISVLSEVLSLGRLKEFRELGASTSNVLGLGRLQRRTLGVLLKETVEAPYTEFLKKKHRPDRLSDVQFIAAFWGGRLQKADIDEMLARKGYSQEYIDELVIQNQPRLSNQETVNAMNSGRMQRELGISMLRQKGLTEQLANEVVAQLTPRLDVHELERLSRYGSASRADVLQELQSQGMPAATAELKLRARELAKLDTVVDSLLGKYRTLVERRFMDTDTFNTIVNALPISDDQKTWEIRLAGATLDFPHKRVTFSELVTMEEAGIVDLSYFDTWTKGEGFSDEDAVNLQLLLFKKEQDFFAAKAAAKKKADAAAAKAAAAAAKAAGNNPPPPANTIP